MAFTFPAAYDGECNNCGFAFMAGDEIGWIDGEIACEDCVYESEDA